MLIITQVASGEDHEGEDPAFIVSITDKLSYLQYAEEMEKHFQSIMNFIRRDHKFKVSVVRYVE